MPDLDINERAKVALNPGQILRVTAAGSAQVQLLEGAPTETATFSASSRDFGPYSVPARLTVESTAGTVVYGLVDYQATLTGSQVAAIQALVLGGGIDVSFLRNHDSTAGSYILDAGSGNVLPVMRVTINAADDVIAGTRIAAGGTNTFQTTISGASTAGEVIPISVGSGVITTVHVGSSSGASQTIDADGTATVNELGKWTCLVGDDCNMVYIRFAPPRSSGRYCDVSIVGKKRGG